MKRLSICCRCLMLMHKSRVSFANYWLILNVKIYSLFYHLALFFPVAFRSVLRLFSSPDHPEEEAIRDADRVWLCLASTSVPDPVQWTPLSVSASNFITRHPGPPQEPLLPVGESRHAKLEKCRLKIIFGENRNVLPGGINYWVSTRMIYSTIVYVFFK